jgi:hypothetical protein
MKRFALALTVLASLGLAACEEPAPQNRGIYMLMDTSGTYTEELRKAEQIINALLSRLDPGDSFAVARIDTGSFSEKVIVAKVTFDDRPSMANKEKRQFRDTIGQFVKMVKPARHTDITGGILQASEFLNEKNTGKKLIVIFSDLEEDLQKGFVRDIALPLDGFEVIALNVTKLRADNVDPRKYLDRLTDWQRKVESGGGRWKVINDLDRLEKLFTQ